MAEISVAAEHRVATVQEQVTHALRQALLSGDFLPGQRLRQLELAQRFGVSAVPVREALRALEQDGLVESVPRRGWVVSTLTVRDVEEIYELREILEQKGLRDAIPRLTKEHIERLRQLTEIMVSSSEPDKHIEARERFYETLYGASGRPRLVSLIMALHGQLAPYLRRQRVRHSAESHLELMRALVERDVSAASRVISAHLAEIRSACVQALEPAPPRRQEV